VEATIDPWLIRVQDMIRKDFNWDVNDDKYSLELLLKRLETIDIRVWGNENRKKVLNGLFASVISSRKKGITVVGAAATPDSIMQSILDGKMLVIADGSIGVLNELSENYNEIALNSILFISSDCDGIPEILSQGVSQTTFLLHAHADNIKSWNNFLDYWGNINHKNIPNIVITHQLPNIIPHTINPGGFTDGDRAICTLIYMGVDRSEISLVGFNSDFVGRWSGITDQKLKIRKLKWMNKILKHLGFVKV